MTLEEIIRYGNEGRGIEFKQKLYSRSAHLDLLKDVMALANADVTGLRYIITGIEHQPSGERKVIGVPEDECVDDSAYQQVVKENIEPDITFSYEPVSFDGKRVGVFTIGPCSDPPYLMRKDYKSLHRGNGYIRNGSSQSLLTRSDYDRMYRSKHSKALGQNVKIGFGTELAQCITTPDQMVEMPSYRASTRIIAILEKRDAESIDMGVSSKRGLSLRHLFMSVPYERRTTEELRENLLHAEETYLADDLYQLQEAAFRLNVGVLNEEDEYLQNATFLLEIPRFRGFVFDKLVPDPERGRGLIPISPPVPHPDAAHYPSVEESEELWLVRQDVGDIINHLKRELFDRPVRLAIGPAASGETIRVGCKLYASNLPKPIEGKLEITFGKTEVKKASDPSL